MTGSVTKSQAEEILARRVRSFFGSVDLYFNVHGPDRKRVEETKKEIGSLLTKEDVHRVIEPIIRHWLTEDYTHYGSDKRGAYRNSEKETNQKISEMCKEVAEHFGS
ncbi:hypothetical protein GM556_03070 [Bombella sp. ESL0378]|uniref:hypothetical protein n=1 Tax=Bombella sp. ESL0378 TaxID=2676442 RepID=UPI0012D94137|nr:hypothetical protein [Bombella sp. ESL0378]MUG04532.1 hypothetical protein [Bombella sp. ESL0378]